MVAASTNNLVLCFRTSPPSRSSSSFFSHSHRRYLPTAGFIRNEDKRVFPLTRSATFRHHTRCYAPLLPETVGDGDTHQKNETLLKEHVKAVKFMMSSMEDGSISVSAYDTAWVALVQDVENGTGLPQFPSTLEWISNNQLYDGSWGYKHVFSAHDRLISTLACVVALKSWSLHPDKCFRGMKFFNENLDKLTLENRVLMTIGFEVAFPSLLDIARSLNLEVSDEDTPLLHEIYARRRSNKGRLGMKTNRFSPLYALRLRNLMLNVHYAPSLPKILGKDRQEKKERPLGLKDDCGASNQTINEHVELVKSMLSSTEDGSISISAYDTAWVALVKQVNGTGLPQFPSSLEWIINNQLEDGSWGYKDLFSAPDRLLSTLACVVALKSWNLHPDKCFQGLNFFKENLDKIADEKSEHMTIGFELTFPSLLDIARSLNLEVPDEDTPVLHKIYARRRMKLSKIPNDVLHNVRTMMLYSLEGMAGLDWGKLLKLQCEDGSFLSSPASTAYALQQTKDPNCMSYLSRIVNKFNGGVPNVYPVDLFERLWAVDRLQRLGLSRYFEPEIMECINYVARFWTEKGITWARNRETSDIDDTSMGFRLLRLHGHKVTAEVYEHFRNGNVFFAYPGQGTDVATAMYNLFRASQVAFPGDKILADAKEFATKFLKKKQASSELVDKWIITKDLPGEVSYALDFPWYASLPRVESRFYIEQYGGKDDVWIGKTLYNMHLVNNNEYLELAVLDYNNCQAIHLKEWDIIQRWYNEWKFGDYGLSEKSLLKAYFIASSSIFEPERAHERLAWAQTICLVDTIVSYFDEETYNEDRKKTFVDEFKSFPNMKGCEKARNHGIIEALWATINQLSSTTMVLHHQDITDSLCQAWAKWLIKWQGTTKTKQDEAELFVEIINTIAGRRQEMMFNDQYKQMFSLTNEVCNQLRSYQNQNKMNGSRTDMKIIAPEVELCMQQLVELVLEKSSDDKATLVKQSFFTVARSFYYSACCDQEIIMSHHINKVLFEPAK